MMVFGVCCLSLEPLGFGLDIQSHRGLMYLFSEPRGVERIVRATGS